MSAVFDDFIPHPVRLQAKALQPLADNGRLLNGQPALASVSNTLASPSQALDRSTQSEMGARFGQDFSRVRVHADAGAGQSSRMVNARAYTVGRDIVFGTGQYAPATEDGRNLIAHELAHVVQQGGEASLPAGGGLAIDNAGEAQADRAAQTAGPGSAVTGPVRSQGPALQRKVEMRDVGRGEQSGFARLPELIERLNAVSTGLTFAMVGRELTYTLRPDGMLSDFDRQMMEFIDQDTLIPLRLTNRHGLLGSRVTGYNDRVQEDDWGSGYVDVDDLLASSDLGIQAVMVHILRERTATRNYAHRIGSESLDTHQPGPEAEYERVHDQAIQSELRLVRDYFDDPTIHLLPIPENGEIFRVYRNSRRDLIRTRVHQRLGKETGVDVVTFEVITHDGRRLTPEEYRSLLEEEKRTARQIERERLGGATEYREGGRSVPAP
jgi:hypothetical protein